MKKLVILKDDSDEIELSYAPLVLEDDDDVEGFIAYWFDVDDLEDHDGYQKNVSVEEESNGVYSAFCCMSRMWTGTKRFKLIPLKDGETEDVIMKKWEKENLDVMNHNLIRKPGRQRRFIPNVIK